MVNQDLEQKEKAGGSTEDGQRGQEQCGWHERKQEQLQHGSKASRVFWEAIIWTTILVPSGEVLSKKVYDRLT